MDFVGPLVILLLIAIPLLYQTGYMNHFLSPHKPTSSRFRRPGYGDTRKIKMIITCDAGIDDADSLILALSHKDVEVLAITTSFGIVDREKVIVNVNRVLQLFPDKKIPVYAGSSRPMYAKPGYNQWEESHGKDGLGDAFPEVKLGDKQGTVIGKYAHDEIFNLVQGNRDCIIVCLGPLTDFALAIEQHPTLATHPNLKHVYVLGGNIPDAEPQKYKGAANLFRDLDAAEMVITKLERPITFIGRGSYSKLNPTSPEFQSQYMNTETKKGKFVQAIRGFWNGSRYLYDEVAMTVAIDPSIIEKSEIPDSFVTVDTDKDDFRKGKIIHGHASHKNQNVELVSGVKLEKVEAMLLGSLVE